MDEEKENLIFVNDYHLAMFPHHLDNLIDQVDIKYNLMSFWHIPWPSWEKFRILPWKTDILDSLLKIDLLGFQKENDVYNFLRTINKEYPEYLVDFNQKELKRGNQITMVNDYQISVDFNELDNLTKVEVINDELKEVGELYPETTLIFSVDRLDYSKGLLHRQYIIDEFLDTHPYYLGKVKFVQVVSPSRINIDSYMTLKNELIDLTEKINEKYRTSQWEPIDLITEYIPHSKLLALYRMANIILITSLQDGMNLVAKEGISCSKNNTAIILSKFTGAAETLEVTFSINPFDIKESSEVIHEVIEMEDKEIDNRLKILREQVREDNIYKWTVDLFTDYTKNFTKQKLQLVDNP